MSIGNFFCLSFDSTHISIIKIRKKEDDIMGN